VLDRGQMWEPVTFEPIGVVRSPHVQRVSAPRQPAAAMGVEGRIELRPDRDLEHAICDLDAWDHIWVLFCFHRNEAWRPKVLPPRSERKRGVLATRSPHRPNPIGLSCLELVQVEGLVLTVRNLDILDGSPVLDIKPYVAYADALPGASGGWMDGQATDPAPSYPITLSELASAQCAFVTEHDGLDLQKALVTTLGLGPQPHPYRRIRRTDDGGRIAIKAWRAEFRVDGQTITVERVDSGYRPKELATSSSPELATHRAFVERFGMPGPRGGRAVDIKP